MSSAWERTFAPTSRERHYNGLATLDERLGREQEAQQDPTNAIISYARAAHSYLRAGEERKMVEMMGRAELAGSVLPPACSSAVDSLILTTIMRAYSK